MLCTNSNLSPTFNNIFTYQLSQAPAFPVTLHYMVINVSGIYRQDSLTVSTINGLVYLPEDMPVGFYNLEVWISGGPCNESSEWAEGGFDIVECAPSAKMVVYPNPAKNELKIGYKELTGNPLQETPSSKYREFNVKLLNLKGVIVKEGKISLTQQEIILQVGDLPNGNYFIHIFENKTVIKKQVIINH